MSRWLLNAAMGSAILVLAGCSGGTGEQAAQGPASEPPLAETQDALILQARGLFAPIPVNPPGIEGLTSTPALVQLGSALYFDPRLSATHSIACASCHVPGLAGTDNAPTSAGFHGTRGGRNAPTVYNAVFNFAQFWDGRAANLVEQAGGPLVNPVEMASPQSHVTEQLLALPGYTDLFRAAFPGDGDPVTLIHAQQAIAAFEATLTTPNAPFDKFLRGDANALGANARAGLQLFIDAGCAACHTGVNLGGTMYQKFGIAADPDPRYRPADDLGRGGVTGNAAENYFYKVPTLRNIALTAPYFHTGSEPDLARAVDVMARTQLGRELTAQETGQIVAFLGSLTGDQPQVVFPSLPASAADSPPPER